jgi:hypothetical protein
MAEANGSRTSDINNLQRNNGAGAAGTAVSAGSCHLGGIVGAGELVYPLSRISGYAALLIFCLNLLASERIESGRIRTMTRRLKTGNHVSNAEFVPEWQLGLWSSKLNRLKVLGLSS